MANNKKAASNEGNNLSEEQRVQVDRLIEQLHAVSTEEAVNLLSHIPIAETREALQELHTAWRGAQKILDEITALKPYINAELEKPEYKGVSIASILEQYELRDLRDGPPEGSTLAKILEAARLAHDTAERVTAKRTKIVEYPLDKPNQQIWNLLESNADGQIMLRFDMMPKKANKQALAFYAIDFDSLEDITITKQLQAFDKRVYIAVSALFNAGNNVVTLPEIYLAMGYKGTPGKEDREKINQSLTKMTGARILFDNKHEAEALAGYSHFKYDGSLLPFERVTAIVNGQAVNAAIKLFREPPLISFAKQHNNQITTIDVKLLQSPISKTNANLMIDDYLIERIGRAKHDKKNQCRILYKTIYQQTHITTAKQKQRAPGKIKKYLNHYQENAFIKRYTEQEDGITIYF